VSVAHFNLGRYEEAAAAGRKAVQSAPGFGVCYAVLAAALVKLGRLDEAKATAPRVAELIPGFRSGQFFAASGYTKPLIAAMSEALGAAGVPE